MKTLYMMVGMPASGKSYFAKNNLMNGPGWVYVSRDEVRFSIIKDDEEYFSHEKEVFLTFIKDICIALHDENVYNVIADATHLSWGSRRKFINAVEFYMGFKMKDVQIILVVMWTDINIIKERNNMRSGRQRVPDDQMNSMYKSLRDPAEDQYKYTAITYKETKVGDV